jgi:hypothetical protein
MAVTIDPDGWTNFTHGPQARTVYVSSSLGKDSSDGLTSAHPVKTLAHARSLLRNGSGDWMLLKAGDVWYEGLRGWGKSGFSKDEPLLISSYGKGERPVLETGDQSGFTTTTHDPIKHVAIVGILFHANTRDPDSPDFKSSKGGAYGVDSMSPIDDLLIENCLFDSYEYNLSIRGHYGPASHVGLRRNVIVDAYSPGGKAQGLYMSHVDSVLIEGNLFDHNGWNEKLPEAHATVFGHNVYLDESDTNVYIRGNIFANAASHGLQARGGGTIQGNLFINNPIGLLFGNGSMARAGGVSGDVSGNVFLGAAGINGAHRGWAIEIANTAAGGNTIVANNIIAQDNQRHYPAIVLNGGNAETVGINDLTLEGNIVYRWQEGLEISEALVPGQAGQNGLNGLIVRNNDFQRLFSNRLIEQGREIDLSAERFSGNRYFSSGSSTQWFRKGGKTASWDTWNAKVDKTSRRVKVKYDDPERTVQSYNATLGGKPSIGAFLTQARLMARRIWDARYAATSVVEYMHQGFKVRKIPPTVTATNLSSANTAMASREIFFLFSKDVSGKLAADDLVVTDRTTKKRMNATGVKLSYDKSTNQATWTFPKLSAGEYDVRLLSSGAVDVKKTALDGDFDGFAGGDFVRQLRVRGTRNLT